MLPKGGMQKSSQRFDLEVSGLVYYRISTDLQPVSYDAAVLKRGRGEPKPVRSGDITTLDQLDPLRGHVVKYTLDGGLSWRYILLFKQAEYYDTNVWGGPPIVEFGYGGNEEVNPSWQSHNRWTLTAKGFRWGMVVRAARPSEYKHLKFSFDAVPPSLLSDAVIKLLLETTTRKLPRRHKKTLANISRPRVARNNKRVIQALRCL